MVSDKVFELFLRKKPALMLIKLKKTTPERYASVIAKEVDCTYSHTVRILQEFKDLKLIEFEKKGRQKIIKLTKSGNEISELFERLFSLFEKLKK